MVLTRSLVLFLTHTLFTRTHTHVVMFPVIKSDYWSKGPQEAAEQVSQDQVQQQQQQQQKMALVTYAAPNLHHTVPLMYSTAPITIHHANQSTYNSNVPTPNAYLPFADLQPPPMYEPMAPAQSLEYTTVYDKPTFERTDEEEKITAVEVQTVDAKANKKRKHARGEAGGPERKPRKTGKFTKLRGGGTADRCGNGLSELSPLKTAAIIDTFEEIEEGLTDSLENKHSAPTRSMLKCCRLSVRTVKRLLIALVAISAVYTAGSQLYDNADAFDRGVSGLFDLFTPTNVSAAKNPQPVVDATTTTTRAPVGTSADVKGWLVTPGSVVSTNRSDSDVVTAPIPFTVNDTTVRITPTADELDRTAGAPFPLNTTIDSITTVVETTAVDSAVPPTSVDDHGDGPIEDENGGPTEDRDVTFVDI